MWDTWILTKRDWGRKRRCSRQWGTKKGPCEVLQLYWGKRRSISGSLPLREALLGLSRRSLLCRWRLGRVEGTLSPRSVSWGSWSSICRDKCVHKATKGLLQWLQRAHLRKRGCQGKSNRWANPSLPLLWPICELQATRHPLPTASWSTRWNLFLVAWALAASKAPLWQAFRSNPQSGLCLLWLRQHL